MTGMIWALLIGAAVGFVAGKLAAIYRMNRWLVSLTPEDRGYVRSLMHPEDRWKENAAHDAKVGL